MNIQERDSRAVAFWSCCEWQLIKFGLPGQIGPTEFYAILDKWRRSTGEDPGKFFDFRADGFRPKNWVGTIGTELVQLEVLPMGADGLDSKSKRTLDRNLSAMVASAAADQSIELPDALLDTDGGRFETLLATFCSLFAISRRKKVIRGYSRERALTRSVRGRLVFPAQMTQSIKQPGVSVSEWVSLSENVPENRYLKAVLMSSLAKCGPKVRRSVQEILAQLEHVEDPRSPEVAWRAIRFDRLTADYVRLLCVGRALLEGYAPGLFAGFATASSEIIFTASAFESFVQQEVAIAASRVGLRTIAQKKGDYLGKWESGVHAGCSVFELVPDIQVRPKATAGIARPCVLDVKWKSLNLGSRTLGIDSNDVYQLMTYANRLNHSTAILVYPWIGNSVPTPDNLVSVKYPSGEVRVLVFFIPMTAPGFGPLRQRLADTLREVCYRAIH